MARYKSNDRVVVRADLDGRGWSKEYSKFIGEVATITDAQGERYEFNGLGRGYSWSAVWSDEDIDHETTEILWKENNEEEIKEKIEQAKAKMDKFKELCQPLVDYLNEHGTPHDGIIITQTDAKMYTQNFGVYYEPKN